MADLEAAIGSLRLWVRGFRLCSFKSPASESGSLSERQVPGKAVVESSTSES